MQSFLIIINCLSGGQCVKSQRRRGEEKRSDSEVSNDHHWYTESDGRPLPEKQKIERGECGTCRKTQESNWTIWGQRTGAEKVAYRTW